MSVAANPRLLAAIRILRIVGWAVGIAFAAYYWWFLTSTGGNAVDAHAYWAADPNALYGSPADPVEHGSYLYSPAFELVIGWGRLVPFEVFAAIWRAVLLVALVWLAGPLTLPVLLFVPVASEVNAGNIQLLLAAAVVAGFRYPASWAFVLLTKFTSGVGLLFFLFRREWRPLAIALGVTLLIVVLTAALWPDRWVAYVQFVLFGAPNLPSVPPYYLPLLVRLPIAVVIVAIGAWRCWRWTVVVAATIALPIFYVPSLAMFVGVLPFVRRGAGRWLGLDRRPGPSQAAGTAPIGATAPTPAPASTGATATTDAPAPTGATSTEADSVP